VTEPLAAKTGRLRRTHVLQAATRAFARRGYERTSIRDVAREAGVSEGTIYNVFDNKAALLLAMLDPLGEAMSGANEGPPADLTDALARRWRSLEGETLDMARIVLSEALVDPTLAERFRATILGPVLSARGPVPAKGRAPEPQLALAIFLGAALLKMLGDAWAQRPSDQVVEDLACLISRGAANATPEAGAP
jgi:AcrR family transcriptional regulator